MATWIDQKGKRTALPYTRANRRRARLCIAFTIHKKTTIIIIVKEKENSDMLTGTRPLSLADAGRPVGRLRAICTRKGESQKLAAAQCGVITVARHHVKWFIYIHTLSFSSFCSFRDRCSCWLSGDKGCGGRNQGLLKWRSTFNPVAQWYSRKAA